jgi:hypothetical protein
MAIFHDSIRRGSPLFFLRQDGAAYEGFSKQPFCETSSERVLITSVYRDKGVLKKLEAAGIDEHSFFNSEHKLIFFEIARLIKLDEPASYERLLPWADQSGITRDVFHQVVQAESCQLFLDDAIKSVKLAQNKRNEQVAFELVKEGHESGHIDPSNLERLLDIVKNGHSDPRRLPPVKTALEIINTPPEDGENLIGNRFLCRGGGMLIVGPSGVGKSTLTAGLCAAFARGESYLHIRPSGPLKILVIQAENDDGDLHEQLQGAIGDLMEGDEATFTERLRFVTIDHLSGSDFLEVAVCHYLETERPDLVVIDCLSAYLGDSPTEPKALITFLRNGLTRLLRQFNCGSLVVHHTSKTTNQNREGWNASDMQYAMAGGADIANWMRSGLLIEATTLPDLFRLHAIKRTGRLGWSNAEGEASSVKLIRHSKPDKSGRSPLRWEVADCVDVERLTAASVKPSRTEKRIPADDEVLALFPQEIEGDNPEHWLMTTADLQLKFKELRLSKNDVAPLMKNLVKAGKLELIPKSSNGKCYALPAIAAEYRRATASVVQPSTKTTRTTGITAPNK